MSGLNRMAILGALMAGAMSPIAAAGNAMRSLTTTQPDDSGTMAGKRNGPGFTAAHVKRMSKKRRNRQRHKAAARKSSNGVWR